MSNQKNRLFLGHRLWS